MKTNPFPNLRPFGDADCKNEVNMLGEEYNQYYFDQTRFNNLSLDRRTFLIVGRRGAGKTALAQYFTFQNVIKNATSINISLEEVDLFGEIIESLSPNSLQFPEIVIPKLVKVWNLLIWKIVFTYLQEKDPRIKLAALVNSQPETFPGIIIDTLKSQISRILGDDDITDSFENILKDSRFDPAKEAVIELARKSPIIIAIDTLDNYSVKIPAMTQTLASLIQWGSDFNRDYSGVNIHLKIFVMAEIFPYLKEEVLMNPLKSVHDEVYLHWRPKDLMRLISWRFHYYLNTKALLPHTLFRIDWEDYNEVYTRVWRTFFGNEVTNGRGLLEKTFPYVLRHTQLRPRQLIRLCNAIAENSVIDNSFLHFPQESLIKGIANIEEELATEVINSYNRVYQNVSDIVNALSGISLEFKGSELDKFAHSSASQWPVGEYSPHNFRQLVAELGIVGRVRTKNDSVGFIEADFEYASKGRLYLTERDNCVIHPMFYKKLNVQSRANFRIYPFPDHPEFKDLEY